MNKNVLIHTCCAPCLCFPAEILKKDYNITGYWYNPNIQGFREYEKRLMTTGHYANLTDTDFIIEDYRLQEWLNNMTDFSKPKRCETCYEIRLEKTAKVAQQKDMGFFTTTLLYSKFQNHDLIKDIGENLAKKYSPEFLYKDFRKGWKKGIKISKELGLYRQEYCGCILSEKERYGVS
ncbi:MAG: epoxyqueuosine reductase QueH [Elusimicrobiota bacterium]